MMKLEEKYRMMYNIARSFCKVDYKGKVLRHAIEDARCFLFVAIIVALEMDNSEEEKGDYYGSKDSNPRSA